MYSLFLLNDRSIYWCDGDLYLMYEGFYQIFCLKTQLIAPFLNINAVALIFCDPVQ